MNMGKSPKNLSEYCAITADEKVVAITEWEVPDNKNIFLILKISNSNDLKLKCDNIS